MWTVAPVDVVGLKGDTEGPRLVRPPVLGQQAVRTDEVGPGGRSWPVPGDPGPGNVAKHLEAFNYD